MNPLVLLPALPQADDSQPAKTGLVQLLHLVLGECEDHVP